jgi:hypothetical protein
MAAVDEAKSGSRPLEAPRIIDRHCLRHGSLQSTARYTAFARIGKGF